jgi:hypothetical protein
MKQNGTSDTKVEEAVKIHHSYGLFMENIMSDFYTGKILNTDSKASSNSAGNMCERKPDQEGDQNLSFTDEV